MEMFYVMEIYLYRMSRMAKWWNVLKVIKLELETSPAETKQSQSLGKSLFFFKNIIFGLDNDNSNHSENQRPRCKC